MVLLTELALVHVNYMHNFIPQDYSDTVFLPRTRLSWMLVQEKPPLLQLRPIQFAHELQVMACSPQLLCCIWRSLSLD